MYTDQLNNHVDIAPDICAIRSVKQNEKFKLRDLVTRRSKQATAATGQARSLFLYHIFCSFYNIFITTLRVAAELYIQILIN